MKIIMFYDTEGTGINTRYDRPFQFAARTYDSDLNLIQTTNIRGRLPRYVLPDPEALLVTGQSINQIQSSPLSHYDFIGQVHENIRVNSPAVVVSYNGLRYDEEILRHSFYANLRAPYVTQDGCNNRVDVLVVARAVAAMDPSALVLPLDDDEKPSFKLANLAAANNGGEHDAHDALEDVNATMHLATIMWERGGRAWAACCQNSSKKHVLKLLKKREPLVHVGWSHEAGSHFYQLIQPITTDATNDNEWLCVDLDTDDDGILSMGTNELIDAFAPNMGYRKVLTVRANAMPMVFSLETAASLGVELPVGRRAADWIMADQGFPNRLRAAATARKAGFNGPSDVWHQLYCGGFFPVPDDQATFALFHQASPAEKLELIGDITDPRAKHMARWLVGSEWPDVLCPSERKAIEDEFRDHLMNGQGIWTTIPSALTKIEELLKGASLFQIALLQQYKQYLINLRDTLAK